MSNLFAVGELWISLKPIISPSTLEPMPAKSTALIVDLDHIAGNVHYTMCGEQHRMDYLSFTILFKKDAA